MPTVNREEQIDVEAAPRQDGEKRKAIQDPLLAQIQEEIEAKVPREMQDVSQRIVTAGLAVLYSQQTRRHIMELLDGLQGGPEDARLIAHGGIKLLEVLHRESKKRVTMDAAFLPLQVLVLYMLDTAARTGRVQITRDFVAQVMRLFAGGYFKFFGIDERQIAEAVQRGAQQGQGGRPAPGAPPGAAPDARPAAPASEEQAFEEGFTGR